MPQARAWQEMYGRIARTIEHQTGVDAGLRLGGVEPEGRLEPAKSIGQSSMTHKVSAASVDEVDEELLGWLRRAHAANL
jgi:hypothetical protein